MLKSRPVFPPLLNHSINLTNLVRRFLKHSLHVVLDLFGIVLLVFLFLDGVLGDDLVQAIELLLELLLAFVDGLESARGLDVVLELFVLFAGLAVLLGH